MDNTGIDISKEYGRKKHSMTIPLILISGSTPVRIHEFLVDEQKSSYEKRVLQLEKDAANASNKAKSDFLANMSHEIRTPKHEVEFIIRGGSV